MTRWEYRLAKWLYDGPFWRVIVLYVGTVSLGAVLLVWFVSWFVGAHSVNGQFCACHP